MTTIPNSATAFHRRIAAAQQQRSASASCETRIFPRRKIITTFLTSIAVGQGGAGAAVAENWGTRSFLRERFFEPGLSAEDAVARIRQTAEGLHDLRSMLESMSWRYVIFYIRLKQAYLSQDLKTAMLTVPENRRKSYVQTANELVDNMAEVCAHYSYIIYACRLQFD